MSYSFTDNEIVCLTGLQREFSRAAQHQVFSGRTRTTASWELARNKAEPVGFPYQRAKLSSRPPALFWPVLRVIGLTGGVKRV
jgi:hypothetical protein